MSNYDAWKLQSPPSYDASDALEGILLEAYEEAVALIEDDSTLTAEEKIEELALLESEVNSGRFRDNILDKLAGDYDGPDTLDEARGER